MDFTLNDAQRQLQLTMRRFVEREVIPVASEYEHADAYPDPIVKQMADMGLFGCILPTEYGGQGFDYISYAIICEELSRGWMSLAGILNSHLMMALMTCWYGSEAQKHAYVPTFARGERRTDYRSSTHLTGSPTLISPLSSTMAKAPPPQSG